MAWYLAKECWVQGGLGGTPLLLVLNYWSQNIITETINSWMFPLLLNMSLRISPCHTAIDIGLYYTMRDIAVNALGIDSQYTFKL